MDDAELKQKLTPEQYRIMRQRGTEAPHTGKFWNSDETGIYTCAACGSILFLSLNKTETERGWPTFTKAANAKNVVLAQEGERSEILCKKCQSHLGYVEDGKMEVNSLALAFLELPDIDWDIESGDEKSDDKNQSPSTAKTLTLSIGGLTLGIALGAGGMYAATPTPPQNVCMPSTTPTATTTAATPKPTGTKPKTTTTTPAQSAQGTTPAATTTTAATTSSADGTSGGTSAGSTP